MHITVAQCTWLDAQNIPKQPSVAPGQLPPYLCLEFPLDQFGSAVPALLPLNSLFTCLLAEHGKLENLNLEQAVFSKNYSISLLSTLFCHWPQKNSPGPAIRKKVNSQLKPEHRVKLKSSSHYDLKTQQDSRCVLLITAIINQKIHVLTWIHCTINRF